MTATDELRRLLDERGVEYKIVPASFYMPEYIMVGDTEILFNDRGEVAVHGITPEQAVEATLGRGECRMEPFIYDDTGAFIECSECGWQLFDADYSIDAAREWLGYCPNCGRKVVDE